MRREIMTTVWLDSFDLAAMKAGQGLNISVNGLEFKLMYDAEKGEHFSNGKSTFSQKIRELIIKNPGITASGIQDCLGKNRATGGTLGSLKKRGDIISRSTNKHGSLLYYPAK